MAMDTDRDNCKYDRDNDVKIPGEKRKLLADAIQQCISSGDSECSGREDSNYIPDAPHFYLHLDKCHFEPL